VPVPARAVLQVVEKKNSSSAREQQELFDCDRSVFEGHTEEPDQKNHSSIQALEEQRIYAATQEHQQEEHKELPYEPADEKKEQSESKNGKDCGEETSRVQERVAITASDQKNQEQNNDHEDVEISRSMEDFLRHLDLQNLSEFRYRNFDEMSRSSHLGTMQTSFDLSLDDLDSDQICSDSSESDLSP